MRLTRITYIGTYGTITNAQLQSYYDALISTCGMDPVGAPVVRDGVNGKLATALFNDGQFTLGARGGKFFINVLLWRDTVEKRALENLTRSTFNLTNMSAKEDDMGEYS